MDSNEQLAAASQKAEKAKAEGPHQLPQTNDLVIQSTLHKMRGFIHVETPFDVDKFEELLKDHPNQPFVKSVMDGLHYGFWLFDDGKWSKNQEDISENYASEEIDLDTI
ncbi:hypothetical protein H0H87_009110 [Tephrocybe sp. NHM501043]|nr:hypothetical protein H0H87_009110 [Tephrocybe sp. NHM501043]